MKKPQALPFFGDAYLADTTHLTTEEHGVYFLLMLAAWRQDDCALPDDDKKLARIAGMTPYRWAKIKPIIMEFWKVDNGRLVQPRLLKEWHYVRQKIQQKRNAAETRWRTQGAENKQTGECERISKRNAPPPPPPQEEPNGSSKNTKRAKPIRKPEGLSDEIWADWKRVRKGAPITATVLKRIDSEATKIGWTLPQAITEAAERGWRGFKADWIKGAENGNRNSHNGNGLFEATIEPDGW